MTATLDAGPAAIPPDILLIHSRLSKSTSFVMTGISLKQGKGWAELFFTGEKAAMLTSACDLAVAKVRLQNSKKRLLDVCVDCLDPRSFIVGKGGELIFARPLRQLAPVLPQEPVQ